jgi:DNA-binding XRE family transcriptional regulator
MNLGRPLKFQSAEELEQKVQAYFEECDNRKESVVTKDGVVVQVPNPRPYTISGLAYFLGTNRQTLINYEERDEYSEVIRTAKAKIEAFVEESLWTPKVATGVMFNLKNNFGWEDKTSVQTTGETTHNINHNRDLGDLSVEELEQLETILSRNTNS